jgi:hypothetical protein
LEGAIDIFSVRQQELPKKSFLCAYAKGSSCHTDCFTIEIERLVSLVEYTIAFLTSPVFKIERWILKLAFKKPSTDEQAHQLANNTTPGFAAWNVEQRDERQLLMSDFSGKTRFWIMVEQDTKLGKTKLFFGSAVLPNKEGTLPKTLWFALMMQFHKFYSIILLRSAKSNMK